MSPQLNADWRLSDTSHPRNDNRTPSLTLRKVDNEIFVTATWTCQWIEGLSTNRREIVQRSINAEPSGAGLYPEFGPTQTVGVYHGSKESEWGTPVVSRLDGGYVFAWSDSTDGIVARLGLMTPSAGQLMNDTLRLSPRIIVSAGVPQAVTGRAAAKFPTMPPFAHISALDSNVGICWQQQRGNSQFTDIVYKRLWQVNDTLMSNNYIQLNTFQGRHRHPSMDIWQDVWWHAYEGVTWEDEVNDSLKHLNWIDMYFQPLATRAESYDPNAYNNWTVRWDHLDSTRTWQWTKIYWRAPQQDCAWR